jgi:folate-binding Fe-S cluster repair protein YgfZ
VTITELDLDAQYRVLREGAGVVRRGGRRRLAVTGAEAADYLQGQLTNEVEALEPGEGCYAALLDRKGHMQGDMRLLRLAGDAFEIETEADAGDAILRHLSMYKVGREVEVEDVSEAATMRSTLTGSTCSAGSRRAPSPPIWVSTWSSPPAASRRSRTSWRGPAPRGSPRRRRRSFGSRAAGRASALR